MNTDKNQFTVKIADLTAEIHTIYPSTYYVCEGYLSDDNPVVKVNVTQEDIQQEIKKEQSFFFVYKGIGKNSHDGIISKEINESSLQDVIVHRKMAEAYADYGTVFMHGAVIAVNEKAFMFTAPSGTGKTTHIKQWLKNLANAYVVNGDKPFIKIVDDGAIAFGTPWCGNENMGTNTKVPLKAIILMERSRENRMEEISFGEAYPFLLQQTYLPHDAGKARKVLQVLLNLSSKVKIYKFYFDNYADDCFEVAYSRLIGEK